MKLKDGFVLHDSFGEQVLVSAAEGSFVGLVRLNGSAAFAVALLKEEITQEQLVERMLAEYDVDRERLEKDVCKVLETLRSIDALDE